jgi:hypothetical protein
VNLSQRIVRTLNLLLVLLPAPHSNALMHKPPLRHSRRRRQMPRPTAKPHRTRPDPNIDKSQIGQRLNREPNFNLEPQRPDGGMRLDRMDGELARQCRSLRTSRELATERSSSINKASSAMRVRWPRFCASAHHSAISSRTRRAASGTYCGTFAQVS